MDLRELKRHQLLETIGFDPALFPNAVSFIDFANVNHWYDGARHDGEGNVLAEGERLEVDLTKLHVFTDFIGKDARLYYGLDAAKPASLAFIKAAKYAFGKHRVFTKPIQQIRHDLVPADSVSNTRIVHRDSEGDYVLIPKCNFDVEIVVDAMRMIDSFDTLILFSGDADFAALLRFLKLKGKRIVIVKGGHIAHPLRQLADVTIEAADIRSSIVYVKPARSSAAL